MNYSERLYQYRLELKNILNNHTDQGHLMLLKEYASYDDRLLYRMAVKFLPLRYDDALALFRAFIDWEKDESSLITSQAADEVFILADEVLIRAKALLRNGELMAAAELVLAMIAALEPELPYASDGITCHLVLTETFGFMHNLAEQITDQQMRKEIFDFTFSCYDSRDNPDRHYEPQFEILMKRLMVR